MTHHEIFIRFYAFYVELRASTHSRVNGLTTLAMMMRFALVLVCAVAVVRALQPTLKTENGTVYLTDGHGASVSLVRELTANVRAPHACTKCPSFWQARCAH